jgi:hypothetical protein
MQCKESLPCLPKENIALPGLKVGGRGYVDDIKVMTELPPRGQNSYSYELPNNTAVRLISLSFLVAGRREAMCIVCMDHVKLLLLS